jgi:uncharacterized membrane protein
MRLVASLLLVAGLGCMPSPPSREGRERAPAAAPESALGAGAFPDSLTRAHDLLSTIELQALGNEPFWSVEITRRAIVYRDPEHQKGISFPYAVPTGRAVGLVFESSRPDSAPHSIRVVIAEQACSDGMSDVRYRYASFVRLDSLELRGCARFRPARVL